MVFAMIAFLLIGSVQGEAQSTDSLKKEKIRNNVIKINLTSLMFYKSAVLVEFEHVVSKSQSFSIQGGFVSIGLGSFLASDSIHVVDFTKNSGFSITGDYRFYLLKENKDLAPHGVYIGPYVGYVHLLSESNLLIGKAPNSIKTEIDVLSIGFEMGYQFLLGKRWTLDFILVGPSLTNYKASMDLAIPINAADQGPVYQKILEAVANRFPVVGSLINDQTADFKGSLNSWNAGFRYSVHLGFRL